MIRKKSEKITRRSKRNASENDPNNPSPRCENFKTAIKEDQSDKLFVVEEGADLKVISKRSMEDTDLLVSIHNSLVLVVLDL